MYNKDYIDNNKYYIDKKIVNNKDYIKTGKYYFLHFFFYRQIVKEYFGQCYCYLTLKVNTTLRRGSLIKTFNI